MEDNTIEKIKKKLLEQVALSEYCDKTIVFGEGKEKADIFLIGEAPGGDEEKKCRPFVGRGGKNLDRFLEIIGIERKEIYLTNVVKLRPIKINPKTGRIINRPPTANEIKFFLPCLFEEIQLVKPKLIVTLGNVPLKAVTKDKDITIGNNHGRLLTNLNPPVFPLYHPASIIYNEELKKVYDEDLRSIKPILDKI